ncbi:Oidioi.mRNA.OKI2018_I69.chr2.g4764.t1.cds [Oikopleura dioica]|uniref:Oidioi.mRNA.OKI2018_I69.chr2.g4764.t1.cds n=1 Tax=Oikopleura dioica TaxID=34765 RepID=A0ABN7T7F9_OIKDI|nr:Oidioi.mRNA.OKI2018_I69.chr2.g4764.t1.cds [Oikopleura dioica]
MSNPYLSEKEKADLELLKQELTKTTSPPAYSDSTNQPSTSPPAAPVVPVAQVISEPVIAQVPVVTPGVVVTQPTGMWKRPYNSLSWCDSEVCLAFWAQPCYYGRVHAKFEGEQACFSACCARSCLPWCCWLQIQMNLHDNIAARRGIQQETGCCAHLYCSACVLAQMFYEISE